MRESISPRANGDQLLRIAVREIRLTGRNTHGVRIMSLEEGDTLAAIARVPPEEIEEAAPPAMPEA